MQFGGIIYLHHPYQSLGWNDSRGENVMRLGMKLPVSDPEISLRVILAMVGGEWPELEWTTKGHRLAERANTSVHKYEGLCLEHS